jgi:hypothetical protein
MQGTATATTTSTAEQQHKYNTLSLPCRCRRIVVVVLGRYLACGQSLAKVACTYELRTVSLWPQGRIPSLEQHR